MYLLHVFQSQIYKGPLDEFWNTCTIVHVDNKIPMQPFDQCSIHHKILMYLPLPFDQCSIHHKISMYLPLPFDHCSIHRLMYFGVRGVKSPYIAEGTLNGTFLRKVIEMKEDLIPAVLSIDYLSNRLYWVDSFSLQLESVLLNGR